MWVLASPSGKTRLHIRVSRGWEKSQPLGGETHNLATGGTMHRYWLEQPPRAGTLTFNIPESDLPVLWGLLRFELPLQLVHVKQACGTPGCGIPPITWLKPYGEARTSRTGRVDRATSQVTFDYTEKPAPTAGGRGRSFGEAVRDKAVWGETLKEILNKPPFETTKTN